MKTNRITEHTLLLLHRCCLHFISDLVFYLRFSSNRRREKKLITKFSNFSSAVVRRFHTDGMNRTDDERSEHVSSELIY